MSAIDSIITLYSSGHHAQALFEEDMKRIRDARAELTRLNTAMDSVYKLISAVDCTTVTEALDAIASLRAAAAERDRLKAVVTELTQARDFNAGIIDGLNVAIAIKDDTIEAQAAQLDQARELLDMFRKNSREVSEGDCIYCNCEQGGGNSDDCYYDCPMNDVRAWLAANAPAPEEEATK